jgi:hypothetical protein
VLPAAETQLWSDDVRVLRWLADTRDVLEARALSLRKESIAEQVFSLGLEDPSAAVTGVVGLLHRLPPDRREAVIATLRRELLFGAHSVAPAVTAPAPVFRQAQAPFFPSGPSLSGQKSYF